DTLIEKRVADLAPVLLQLLDDEKMRAAALRGLASFPHESTPDRILALYPKLTLEEKRDAVTTLAARKDYALELLAAMEKNIVARTDVSAFVARQLFALNDARVTEQLKKVWGEVRETSAQKQEQLAKYKGLLSPAFLKKADVKNGRLLFSKSCQQCHKLHGEGGDVGPDLTGTNRSELEYLLSNLVDPSSEVARDYRMSVLITNDGRVITGLILERSPSRYIVRTATERIVLAKEDVDSVTDSRQSIMPEGQLDALNREQVRDLIAYLGSKTQVPLPK
ncbi:MAG: c-type cytochrome, partial [Gemmataceae bacterium]